MTEICFIQNFITNSFLFIFSSLWPASTPLFLVVFVFSLKVFIIWRVWIILFLSILTSFRSSTTFLWDWKLWAPLNKMKRYMKFELLSENYSSSESSLLNNILNSVINFLKSSSTRIIFPDTYTQVSGKWRRAFY